MNGSQCTLALGDSRGGSSAHGAEIRGGGSRSPLSSMVGRWVLDHWILLAATCWLAAGTIYLTLPPSPDQFNHAYMGWRLLEGDVPYRDFIDMNWPGVMALHALAIALFGVNLWSWRALDFLLFAASAVLLADLVLRIAGRDGGRLALIFLPITYAIAGAWVSGQHDMSAAQFLVAALWFHVRGYESRSWWWQLGTGLFIGAAMLNKPTVGSIGVLLPLQALWLHVPPSRVFAHTVATGLAAVGTLLVALLAVVALGSSLREVLEAIYTYNLATHDVDSKPLSHVIAEFFAYQLRHWSPLTLAAVPAIFWVFQRSYRSIATTALPVLWFTGILSYFAQWQGLGYHMAPCYLALAGLAPAGVALVATGRVRLGRVTTQRTIGAGLIGLVLAGIGFKLCSLYQSLPAAVLLGGYEHHLARFWAGDSLNVADAIAFTRRLEAIPERKCVLVVGTTSAIHYLSRNREPTRFYYFPVIDRMRSPLPMSERWLDLWEEDLKNADCRFALVARWVITDYRGPRRAEIALRKYLQGYRKTGVLGGGMVVYRRN
jgi:4-amino-4-deoxy-L-arabinose transferase-like glycosyltransferase